MEYYDSLQRMVMIYMQEYPTIKMTHHDSLESQKRMLPISSLLIILIKAVMTESVYDIDEKTYSTSFLQHILLDMQIPKGIIQLIDIL